MVPDNAAPISRPFPLHRVTPAGLEAEVVASPAEREALAADLGLVAIHDLVGRFRVVGTSERIRVAGRISARIEQTCVVTLDPFPTELDEEVSVEFVSPALIGSVAPTPGEEVEADLDRPEELTGDRIDLGAITAEFLALALDPYPRKPGVSFEAGRDESDRPSAFAGLASLRRPGPEEAGG